MESLRIIGELFLPGFLASLAVGLVIPAIGALMLMKRAVFLGVAIPQISAAGLALGLMLLPWFPSLFQEFLDHGHPPGLYMLAFTLSSASLALWALGSLSARAHEQGSQGRYAASFALGGALTVLFLTQTPVSSNLVEPILHGGQILLLDSHGLVEFLGIAAVVMCGLHRYRRGILLCSFDPDAAVAAGIRLARYERLQMFLIGLTIAGGITTAGPILIFGLLFLPPLAARQLARNMRSFLFQSVLVGELAILGAWPLALRADLPYGPAAVVLAFLLLLAWWAMALWRGRPARAAV